VVVTVPSLAGKDDLHSAGRSEHSAGVLRAALRETKFRLRRPQRALTNTGFGDMYTFPAPGITQLLAALVGTEGQNIEQGKLSEKKQRHTYFCDESNSAKPSFSLAAS
jgi:hypothetical protein